ncbi:hypothetical protein Nmel_000985 [Mimus melanotis]
MPQSSLPIPGRRCSRSQFPACPRSLTCCNLPLHGNLRFLQAFVVRSI